MTECQQVEESLRQTQKLEVINLAAHENTLMVREANGGFKTRALEVIAANKIAVSMVNSRQVWACARAGSK